MTVVGARDLLDIAGDAATRGRARGQALGPSINLAWTAYLSLFGRLAPGANVSRVVKEVAGGCHDALRSWAPGLAAEVEAVAAGAGVELTVVAGLNARTEILAALGCTIAECSTIAGAGRGLQTWDWFSEFSELWHGQRVAGDRFGFAGLTEHGVLAKIGVNSAGLGVLLNILAHASSAAAEPGVPIHLITRRILGEAGTVPEALEIASSARVSAGSVLTVLTEDSAAWLEVSAAGVRARWADTGEVLTHTNHYLAADLTQGEAFPPEDLVDSRTRLTVLDTVAAEAADGDTGTWAAALSKHQGPVCVHARQQDPLPYETLATVTLRCSDAAVRLTPEGPCRRRRGKRLRPPNGW